MLAVSGGTLAAILVVVAIDLFALLFGLAFIRVRRAERVPAGTAAAGLPAPEEVPSPTAPRPLSRREFFRRSLVTSFGVFAAQFGGATIAFVWPNLKGGFGSVITAGTVSDIQAQIDQTGQPFYSGAGRFYLVKYAGSGRDEATGVDYEAEGAVSSGLMALYQKCPHLGCRVPFCQQSKWFECPCHGSKYNEAGEYELGPAPRGMDRFKIIVDGDVVKVDTSEVITGPPRGTDSINQTPGPFCVAPG